MNKRNKGIIKLVSIFFILGSIALISGSMIGVPVKNTAISGQISLQVSDWTDYDCDNFDGMNKLFNLMETFYFTYSTTSLHYGVYLGALFICEGDTVSIVIYAFVKTLDQNYVSSLSATFTYSLSGSYKGHVISLSGAPSDTAPFMTSDPCLYEYPLYYENYTKESGSDILSLSISYTLHSTYFDVSDNYSCTQSMSMCIPFVSYYLLLAVVLAMLLVYVRNRQKYSITF